MSVDLAGTTQKLHKLLKGTSPEDRQKIIAAVLTLFGDAPLPVGGASNSGTGGAAGGAAQHGAGGAAGKPGARQFFQTKSPKKKVEELAVAAYYHEQYENGVAGTTRDDFERIYKDARRTFDKVHYNRDLGNAKTAKLFNTGTDNLLSHYGQDVVDALPDRAAVKAIPRPGKVSKKKKAKKA